MTFEKLGGDLVQRTGGDARGHNAQFLGFRKDFLVLDSKFLRYVVNPNGHNLALPPP